jgi:hypothetical protein
MISKSKLAALALAAIAAFASPALAQSLETGTAADTYGWNGSQGRQIIDRATAPANGLGAFAMVPRIGQFASTNDPAATGGGSGGYNEGLLKNE